MAVPPESLLESDTVTVMSNSGIGAKVMAIVSSVIISEHPEHISVSPVVVVIISPGTTP